MLRGTYQPGLLSIFYSIGSKPLELWGEEGAETKRQGGEEQEEWVAAWRDPGCWLGRGLCAREQSLALRASPRATSSPLPPTSPIAVSDGTIARVTDEDLGSSALELWSTSPHSASVSCPPPGRGELGATLPLLVLQMKSLGRPCSIEVECRDARGERRRVRASTYVHRAKLTPPGLVTVPLSLEDGWNSVQFDLPDLLKRAFAADYASTARVRIHASCRVRRVYLADRAYREDELPPEFRLFAARDRR